MLAHLRVLSLIMPTYRLLLLTHRQGLVDSARYYRLLAVLTAGDKIVGAGYSTRAMPVLAFSFLLRTPMRF
jgi:hypothetical protein